MRFDWWTFGLQTVNFLILAWLLQRFLYQPVMRVVAARREASEHLLAEAEAGRRKAEQIEAELAQRRQGMEAERDKLLAEARKAAQAETGAAMERSRAEAARAIEEAQQTIRRHATDALDDIRQQAARLAAAMATRLAQSAPPPPEPFLDRLADTMATLPASTRAALRAGPLEVATAAPLTPEAQKGLRRWLADWLGTQAEPVGAVFVVDPSLLAGLELRTPHAVLRSSWAADLERLAAEVTHDDACA